MAPSPSGSAPAPRAAPPTQALGCSLLNAGTAGPQPSFRLSQTSFVPLLDAMLVQETGRLRHLFSVQPDFSWFDDGPVQTHNAFATDLQIAGPSEDGSILMGIGLCHNMLQAYSNLGPYAVWVPMTVLAHEYGHILQFRALKSGSGARHQGKYPELHADVLAGAYMGQRAVDARVYFGSDIMPAVMAAWQQFHRIGDTNFSSPAHHGTHQERAQAFSYGVGLIESYAQAKRSVSIGALFSQARRAVGY